MGVLRKRWSLVVAIAATGCYSPDLPDCVTACAQPDDCAPGQVCGGDGLCAAPELADSCDEMLAADARPPRPDARENNPIDAQPDALTMAVLRVEVIGAGRVKTEAPIDDNCDSDDAGGAICTYNVAIGTSVKLKHMDRSGWHFDMWTGACVFAGADCTLVVGPGTTSAGAAFED